MAISNPTLLDTKTLTKASALNSASISPSANALLIIVHCVLASSGSGWTDAVSDSFGANLGDWSSVGVEIDGAATVHMWIHYAQCGATPGSGTVSVDPSDGTRQIMFVLELTGHNTTSPVTQYKTYSSDATPTSPEITLDSSPASGSLVLGAIGGGVGTTSSGATSGTGFTELADTRVGSPIIPIEGSSLLAVPTYVTSCAVQYDNGGADTTCDWSLSNYGQTITGIALEIAAASGGGTAHEAAATLANTSEMTAGAVRRLGTSSTFTTTSEMTAAGIRGLGAAAALTLTSTMTAAAIRGLYAAAALTTTSEMTAAAIRGLYASVAFGTTSEMTAAGIRTLGTSAALALTTAATAAGTRQLGAAGQLDITSEMTAAAIRGLYASVAFGTTSEMTALGWILAKGAGARVPYNVANRPTNGTTTRTSATTNNRDAYEVSHRVTHEADTRGEVEIEY